MRGDKFKDFRNGWNTVLKGILFRIILIGLPQMVVLCFWEFTRDDSGAEIVLAIFTIFSMLFILGWAASKVIRLARRSISMHKNPAYILYSDPVSLNKWGFLYVQFKASAYWFIIVALAYILIKGLFVALAQGSGTAQAIAFGDNYNDLDMLKKIKPLNVVFNKFMLGSQALKIQLVY